MLVREAVLLLQFYCPLHFSPIHTAAQSRVGFSMVKKEENMSPKKMTRMPVCIKLANADLYSN